MDRVPASSAPDELRCACGKLLARLTDAGIELKCPRCRSIEVIAWSAVSDERKQEEGCAHVGHR